MKILILRFSSIGDILLSTPIIRLLKTQLDTEVHYATKSAYNEVLQANPYLEKIHLLKSSLDDFKKDLIKENFDIVIDLESSSKTRLIKSRLGKKSFTSDRLRIKKWLLVNFKIDKMPNGHTVERQISMLSSLGIKSDNLGLDYFIPEKDEVENDWLPVTHQNGYAVFVIGASHMTKRLPTKRMIELCDRINKPIILVGDSNDENTGNEIESFFERGSKEEEKNIAALNKNTHIFNACGKFNFNQSASIVKKASWVFSHDNDMMHVAAAFKKTIYSIWGSSTPSFGNYPYRTKFIIFENKKIGCRPCSAKGFEKCPKGHFKCMNELTFDFYLPD